MDPILLESIMSQIAEEMDGASQHVFNENEIGTILRAKCDRWNIGETFSSWDLRDELVELGYLDVVELQFRQTPRRFYTWGRVPLLEVVSRIDKKGYFSHSGAAYLHGLASMPATLYFNIEQRAGSTSTGHLTQKNIDLAFSRPARVSTNILEFESYAICLISGKNTQNLGVTPFAWKDGFGREIVVSVTNLERTLIDLAVRPICSGGPSAVLSAYHKASSEVDVPRLVNLLEQIAHLYPYHQSIGLYMDLSGAYAPEQLALLKQIPMPFEFYLANQMTSTRYESDWRIHVPADL